MLIRYASLPLLSHRLQEVFRYLLLAVLVTCLLARVSSYCGYLVVAMIMCAITEELLPTVRCAFQVTTLE